MKSNSFALLQYKSVALLFWQNFKASFRDKFFRGWVKYFNGFSFQVFPFFLKLNWNEWRRRRTYILDRFQSFELWLETKNFDMWYSTNYFQYKQIHDVRLRCLITNFLFNKQTFYYEINSIEKEKKNHWVEVFETNMNSFEHSSIYIRKWYSHIENKR